MTLEDFFTLTEMKDGLTSHSRVEELVSVMQKDKDSVVKNVIEAARQWSTVASTLAATENRDSLDHFIRLNGLCFLDQWLQEAQKFSNDACDSSVEESISLLLGALKKLPIDNKRSVSSGIGVTVKKLFVHKSFRVQEKARALFDVWNQGRDNSTDDQGSEKDDGIHDDRVKQADGTVVADSGCLKHVTIREGNADEDIDKYGGIHDDRVKPADGTVAAEGGCLKHFTTREENADDDIHIEKTTGIEHQHSRCSDGSQSDSIRDVKNSVTSTKDNNQTTLNQEDMVNGFRENAQGSSFMSSPRQESISKLEESSTPPAERMASMGICSIPDPVEWRSSDIPKLKDLTNDAKETDIRQGSPDKSGEKEISCVSATSGIEPVLSADPANGQQPVMQPDVLSNVDAKETEFCLKKTLPAGVDDDMCTLDTEPKSVSVESGTLKHSRSAMELEGTDQAGGCYSDVLQNSSIDGCLLRKPDNLEASFSGKQDIETVDNVKELAGDSISKVRGGKSFESTVAISKPVRDAKVSEINKRSDMEFEYGVDDALEVARQVAIEVEREVEDYRKQFCSSSSEKNSDGRVVQPSSPDSINDERDQPVMGPQNKTPIRQNLTSGAFSENGEDHLMNSENVDKTEDCMHRTDSSQDTETLQKSDDKSKKGLCGFDLNELCSEEMDHPRTPCSVSITFVSASKVTPAGVPRAPFHFEGELGWKGSAATSAFRPASARRTPDSEKPLSVEGSSQSSKQRQDFLDIDLNVAEGYGDGATNPALGKQIPVSSDLPSGESSIEVSSRRAQRLKLDLNRIGDNEDTPSDCRMEERFVYPHRNGSPSPASSSSSRQFPMRNIDLNGNPSLLDDSSDPRPGFGNPSLDMNSSGGVKLDDPVVSILGARVAIDRTEFVPQTRSFLPNGRGIESPVGAVFTRSDGGLGTHHPMAYTPPPSSIFGYNGFNIGSSVSLSPAIYGPGSVPCMVDSRGAPIIPQMMASPSDVLSSSQPPFLMSMSSPLMGLNGIARPSFDLNSGLTVVEAESRESGGLRQLFIPGQGILMEEQMRSGSQSLSSGMGAKRKEPDGGWDFYPVGYKHQPPWR